MSLVIWFLKSEQIGKGYMLEYCANYLSVFCFDELRDVRVLVEDVFNHPDRSKELYLLGVL